MIGQSNYFKIDSLSNNAIKLTIITNIHENSYQFSTSINSDSIFWIMPKGLPKGYFEAYYYNDTNRIALVYYNYGSKSYAQQFYSDGSMKADTEYNRLGDLHGLHVIYDRKWEEVWHAEYNFGVLEPEYDMRYLKEENSTTLLLKNKNAFGTYEFTPTPSRSRRDRITLRPDSTFTYQYSQNKCHFCFSFEGVWTTNENYIILELSNKKVWKNPTRKFAVTANNDITKIKLIEVKDWGVEWYNSDYKKSKK